MLPPVRGSAPVPLPMRYWTAAVTFWREEYRAAHHVENLGLKYYLPQTSDHEERRVLLFPGIIFVKLAGEGWQLLFQTKGIAYPIMMPIDEETSLPAQVRKSEIKRIQSMETADWAVRQHPRFRDGMTVVVEPAGGVYEGVKAVVKGTPRQGRVSVQLQMLGKTVRKDFAEAMLRAA